MTIALSVFAVLIGLVLNLLLGPELLQPDWALALLLGALVAHRGHWLWVLPCVWVHDLVFYWSSLISLPWFILTPMVIAWCDAQIGPNIWQRIVAMVMVVASLWFWGWSAAACVLTMLLSLFCWYLMARLYVKPA
ncbi:MAG: hypothetical protein R8K49_09770 [Mariprofundaceae bacterium]